MISARLHERRGRNGYEFISDDADALAAEELLFQIRVEHDRLAELVELLGCRRVFAVEKRVASDLMLQPRNLAAEPLGVSHNPSNIGRRREAGRERPHKL